jgi:pyruvate formate lyase activating enzyme
MDTVVIDLKAFTEEFYRDVCDAELAPVLESLKIIKAEGVWLEIVYLVIPTLNDDMEEIEQMSRWIKEKLGEETPVHFSRFFPCYKLAKLFPTPLVTLEEACRVARKAGLHYVYIQNVPGHKFSNTLCPKCGKILIGRKGFMIMENNIEQGRCKFCGHEIPGLWE